MNKILTHTCMAVHVVGQVFFPREPPATLRAYVILLRPICVGLGGRARLCCGRLYDGCRRASYDRRGYGVHAYAYADTDTHTHTDGMTVPFFGHGSCCSYDVPFDDTSAGTAVVVFLQRKSRILYYT